MPNGVNDELFSLRWSNFPKDMSSGFHKFLEEKNLVDVTLACQGRFVQAHKIVLSVCSPYFKELFQINPCKHPIVILKDVNLCDIQAILQFMYRGEVSVREEDLVTFLKTAEGLMVQGLTGYSKLNLAEESPRNPSPSPPAKRKRVAESAPTIVAPVTVAYATPVTQIFPLEQASTEQYNLEHIELTQPKVEPPDYDEEDDHDKTGEEYLYMSASSDNQSSSPQCNAPQTMNNLIFIQDFAESEDNATGQVFTPEDQTLNQDFSLPGTSGKTRDTSEAVSTFAATAGPSSQTDPLTGPVLNSHDSARPKAIKTVTNRGRTCLIYQGYSYTLHGNCVEFMRWKCTKSSSYKCKAALRTEFDGETIIFEPQDHNHCCDIAAEEVRQAKSRLKELAQIGGVIPSQIYKETVEGLTEDVRIRMPKEETTKRQVRRWSQKATKANTEKPQKPNNSAEILE